MSQVRDAGPYTITTGIYRGREHVFVTHRATGRQWASKSEHTGSSLEMLADSIGCGMHKFRPEGTGLDRYRKPQACCDTRFWMPVTNAPAMPRSEFDSLVFIGD